jgi:GntR family transcriptional regulator, transcriptional repressor for pyruvate dehydrogenase complex
MIRPAKRTTLYKEVINQIIEMIKSKKWHQGERIPGEIELARQFQVSRNCVREALKALAHAEILEARPGSGTFLADEAVRKVHTTELGRTLWGKAYQIELMQARIIIEPQLAEWAALHASEADFLAIERAVKKTVDVIKSNTYSLHVGFEFHMAIVATMKNRVLLKFYESIADEMKLQRGVLILSHQSREDLMRELGEHEAIYECIKKNDGAGSKRLMKNHLVKAIGVLTKSELVK